MDGKPEEGDLPTGFLLDVFGNWGDNSYICVKQEDWEKYEKDIKSFSDVCKIFEVK